MKRNDRNANGGGAFITYKANIKVNEVKGVGKSCELVMFKIEVGSLHRCLLAHSTDQQIETLLLSCNFKLTLRGSSRITHPKADLDR